MKIGFLITARLKSSRLPMKLLKELDGKTVIEQVIDRIKQLEDIHDIVLCTSTNPQDFPLVQIADKNEIFYFMGDEEDVIQRLLTAAKFFGLDYFIGITGENPLFSINTTNEIVALAQTDTYDFVYSKGLPIGTATYAIRTKALEVICEVKEEVDTEIWGYLINRPEIFNIKQIDVPEELTWPELRITMDYPEDYQFIQNIFSNLDVSARKDLAGVLQFLRENPELIVNSARQQLDLDQETKDRIEQFFQDNQTEILELKNKIYDQG